jgi:hypothetical protein
MGHVTASVCDHCGTTDLSDHRIPLGWFELNFYHPELRGLDIPLLLCSAACVIGAGERLVVGGADVALEMKGMSRY